MLQLSQPPARWASIEQMNELRAGQDEIKRGQTELIASLAALVGGQGLRKPASARRASAASAALSAEESDGEELETTVTMGAGHTPVARTMQRSKARRVSLEERGQRVLSTARSADREVLGLGEDRLRSAGAYLSSIADEMDEEDDDTGDAAERKVNTQHTNNSSEQAAGRQRLIVKRVDKRAASTSPSALHPDLFSPLYDETESVVSLLSKSLGATAKSKKKFTDKKQLQDMLGKGREHAIAADGLTERLAGTHTSAWWVYESYLYKLLIEKGFEAADWYHRQLFERISLGQHSLVDDGPINAELLRDLDRLYTWLSESQLASRKPASASGDRFRANKSGGGGGGGSSSGSSYKAAKQQAAFTGVPCKHHGANARHTTAECKDPKHAGAGGAASHSV